MVYLLINLYIVNKYIIWDGRENWVVYKMMLEGVR